MEDWFYQMGNPLKIKNLLTYLLTYRIRRKHMGTLDKRAFFSPSLFVSLTDMLANNSSRYSHSEIYLMVLQYFCDSVIRTLKLYT